MRIITGSAKGTRLETLEGEKTRPTTERVKEAIFSVIQFDIEGRRVLDLFGGSGQMALEALSRGAESATIIDNNIEAALTVIQYIYDNIMYAELNIKSDYCQECGWDKEIQIVEDESGKLVWECPNCGNRDQSKMNVARRTCGYIGTQYFNQGRTAEIKDRFVHMDCHDCGC